MSERFPIDGVRIEHFERARAALRLMGPVVSRIARDPRTARHYVAVAVQVARRSGWRGLLRYALRDRNPIDERYANWVRAFDTLDANDRSAIAARIATMDWKPTISVIVPLY